MSRLMLLLHVGLVLALCLSAVKGRESEETCAAWGFSPGLLCSSCTSLSEFVKEKGKDLVKDCLKCCAEDTDGELSAQYPYATLHIDEMLLPALSSLDTFVNLEADDFPGFAVKYRVGSPPVLSLENEKMKKVFSTGVENWTRQMLREFLQQKLTDGKGKRRSAVKHSSA